RLVPALEREIVGDDPFGRHEAAREEIDGDRIAVRAKVRAADVELLEVADDRPVDRRIVSEHRELDEAAELADEIEPLHGTARAAGGLDVDVAAVAGGPPANDRPRIAGLRVDHDVGAVAA